MPCRMEIRSSVTLTRVSHRTHGLKSHLRKLMARVVKELGVDTGDPGEARISSENMKKLKVADGPNVKTNFGLAKGGWVCINMPELGLEK
ncbi:hypothetical protein FJZ31_02450 [Candidatus Poribacteria bacterium]|nr:hypothetical protein [Candidatus Poribacteria bacterium]